MQSAPGAGVGTNLALADWFDFYELNSGIKLLTQFTNEELDGACGATRDKTYKTLSDKERVEENIRFMHMFPSEAYSDSSKQ